MFKLSSRLLATAAFTIAVGLFLVAFSWHVGFSNLLSDSGIYLLLASKFSPGQSIPDPLYELIMTEYHLPPGYSIALALFGAGAHHATLAHAVNALFLTAGIIAYLIWVKSNGLPNIFAYALTILFMLLPATLYYSLEILSEHLYLPLSLLGLLFMQRIPDAPRPYIAAILVGLAILTRSIGVALLPALILSTYRFDPRMTLKVLAVALVFPCMWFLYRSQYAVDGYIYSFLQTQQGHDLLSYLWQRSATNLHVIWLAWNRSLDLVGLNHSALVGTVVLFVATAEWFRRLWRLCPDAVYVGCYLCIILVWPHGSHIQRFLFPLLPLFLFYAVMPGYDLAARYKTIGALKLVPCAIAVAVLLVALPTHARILSRTLSPPPEQMGAFSRSQQWLFAEDQPKAISRSIFLNRLHSAIRQSGSIAEQDCIWSIDPPRHMLLSLRVSLGVPPPDLDQDEFQARLRKCRYVFVMNVKPHPNPHGFTAMYPLARLTSASVPVQTTMNSDNRIVSVLYRLADAKQQ